MSGNDASEELLRLHAELQVAREAAQEARRKALEVEAENARIRAINADLIAAMRIWSS